MAIQKEKERRAKPGPRFGEGVGVEDQRVPAAELLLRIGPDILSELAKLPPGTKLVVGQQALGPIPSLSSRFWADGISAFNRAQVDVGPLLNDNPSLSVFRGGRISSQSKPVVGAFLEAVESWGNLNLTVLVVDENQEILGQARTSFRDQVDSIDLPESLTPLPAKTRTIAEAYTPSPNLAPHFGGQTPLGKRILIPLTPSTVRFDPTPAFDLREHHPVKTFVGDPVSAMIQGEDVIAVLDADTVSPVVQSFRQATNLKGAREILRQNGYQVHRTDGWTVAKGRKVGLGSVSLPEMVKTLAELKATSWLSFERRFSYLKTRNDPLWTIDWDIRWMKMARPAMVWGSGRVTPRLLEANPELKDGSMNLSEATWNASFLQRLVLDSTPKGEGYAGVDQTFGDYLTSRYNRTFTMQTSSASGYMAEDQNGERYWVTADELGFRAGCASVNPQPAGVTIKWAPWKKLWPGRIMSRRVEMKWISTDFNMLDAATPVDCELTSQQPLELKNGFPSVISHEARADYERSRLAAVDQYRNGWGF